MIMKTNNKRSQAFDAIAPLSFAESTSRAQSLANMRVALGNAPSGDEVKAAKVQWVIGRVASRMPANALPKGTPATEAGRLAASADLVCRYAYPVKEGAKAKALRKGQIGRRSATQHKIVRAAEEAVSVFFAELGLTGASTNAERDAAKAKRAPQMAGSSTSATPSHAELVKPAAQVSSDDYVQHMTTQLAALCAFDSKYAKKRPTTHGAFAEALMALKQVANKAANEYEVRKAEATAKAK